MVQTHVMIVGAGPIGLELAVSFKHLGVDYIHVDAGQIGQTIGWYPNQTRFFSSPERIAIAGVPLATEDQTKATKEQYLAYLRSVAQQFDLHVRTYERVEHIQRQDDHFALRTVHRGQNRHYQARHVVLAIGDMHQPRMLDIPGEPMAHVSHYFHDPHPYFQQNLLIVGGKNSAAEAALRCYHAGARVAISYRRRALDDSIKYWILPELKSLIKHRRIHFYPCTQPTAIDADHVTLEHTDADGRLDQANGQTQRVPADFVLLLTGYQMNPTLLKSAGVTLEGENQAPRLDAKTMMTNVPNLYVAGTAAAGTQLNFRLFIENCHPHVTRIVQSITGGPPPAALVNRAARQYGLPES